MKQTNLTSEQLQKWNEIKNQLAISELLNIAIAYGHWGWDEKQTIPNDCMEICFQNLGSMTPGEKQWLGNVCMSQNNYDGIKILWRDMLQNNQDGSAEALWNLSRHIDKISYNSELNNLGITFGKFMEELTSFFIKNPPKDMKVLEDFLQYHSINTKGGVQKSIIPLYRTFYLNIDNAKELASFLFNGGREMMKTIGVLDEMLVKLFSFNEGPYRMLYAALESKEAYPYAVNYLHSIAPNFQNEMRGTDINICLKYLNDEDQKKFENLLPQKFLKTIKILEEICEGNKTVEV